MENFDSSPEKDNRNRGELDSRTTDIPLQRSNTYVPRNTYNPLDRGIELVENLQRKREDEMSRILKLSLQKDSDEKQKLILKKIFRFLFGRKRGERAYQQCLRDKAVYYPIFERRFLYYRAMTLRP